MIFAALPLLAAVALSGQAAFKDGDFAAAAQAYTAAWQADPADSEALFGLAQIAIYENQLGEARSWLSRAVRIAPNDPRIAKYRTTIDMRTDPAIDRVTDQYGENVVPFVTTDPLPSVRVLVDGHPATFLIDTGAPNIVLDPAFARSIGLTINGSHEGTFAGGMHASVGQSMVEQFTIGSWTIEHVPASVLPVGNMLDDAHPVQGVIGSALFTHFLATLDYAHGSLVLRSADASDRFERYASGRGATIVPMWLVGDHFIFIRAHAGDGPEGLFNVDTGGTFGLQLTKPAIEAAHVTLQTDKTSTGMGGGGATAFVPFTSSVAVGSLTEDNVDGVYTPQGDQFGIFPFTVTGTISHEFFRHTALTFDFRAMRLVIEPASPAAPTQPSS